MDEELFDTSNPVAEAILKHYGTKRHSGRYPWGSGDNPYQHSSDWLARVKELQTSGKTEGEIAEIFGLGAKEFRAYRSIAIQQRRLEEGKAIENLEKEGLSPSEIGRKLGMNESSVRTKLAWYKKQHEPDPTSARAVADYIKDAIDELGGSVDVGEGVARKLKIPEERMEQAISILENEGYSVKTGMIDRVTDPTSNNKIALRVVGKGQLPNYYIRDHIDEIHSLNELNTTLEDGEKKRPAFVYPESMDSKRIAIKYAEDGGLAKDGLVEIRRGVKDLDMGEVNYAQVRILVDGDRYIKGMAVYKDDMPDGIDIVFNTNKKQGTPMRDVLKEVKRDSEGNIDRDNPFGSLIKENGGQTYYDDPNGKYVDPITGRKQSLSLINKRAEEGDWDEWAKKLPSQFLSKQPKATVTRQLGLSIDERNAEYADILEITNPTIKRDQLLKFADSCENNAVTLKAAAFPGQRYQVILPMPSLKSTEVYAPNYEEGTQVALIRYPHGGTFEIPILTVNNRNKEGRAMIGNNPRDAVGINSKVAERLSGADFDGDTVQVIPLSDKVNVKSTPPLNDLIGFDPKTEYGTNGGKKEGVTYMKREEVDPVTGRKRTIDNTQKEMGAISNLITDMTVLGATDAELARAVKHSMVVIDAAKHKLDYKQSEIDNDIKSLKRKYQGKINEKTGRMNTPSATIISRAGAEASTERTVGSGRVDPETGKMVYKIDTRPNKKGEQRMMRTTQMAKADDAMTLVSDFAEPREIAYAKYANTLKDMAKEARKEYLRTKEIPRSPSAAQVYAAEVKSLKGKLEKSMSNQDVERWAQLIANQRVRARREEDPYLDEDKKLLKKLRQQYLTRAREETGAQRTPIKFTDREWAAIQAGAIGHTLLTSMLKYADPDEIKQRTMPRYENGLTPNQARLIKTMASNGYTQSQIAERFGISTATVNDYLHKK